MTRRRIFIRCVARELATYIRKHPGHALVDLRWRIYGLTGGGDGYSDRELDFLVRSVRFLNRRQA